MKEKNCQTCIYLQIRSCKDKCIKIGYPDWSDKHQDLVGKRVVRGGDWDWGDQDKNGEGLIVQGAASQGWVSVRWDYMSVGNYSVYRMGHDNCWDLRLVEEDEKQKTLEERVAKVSEKFTARRKGLSEGVVIPDESKENMYMQMYGEAVSPWHSLKEATNTEDKMANLVGRSVVKQWLSMDTDIWARASISLGASVRLVSAGISFYDDEKVERKRMRAKRILGELRL